MQFFFQIEVQVISNPSSRLEKHQTPEFLVMNDFYDFFYESSFSAFSNISKNNHCMLFSL